MMDERATQLRRELVASTRRTVRYSAGLKARAIRYMRAQRALGASYAKLGHALGLPTQTIRRWSARTPTMLEVEIAPEATVARGLAIVTSGGERREGLSREEAIAILRALR